MRRAIIAGNWKMNLDGNHAIALASGIAERAGEVEHVDLVVCPPHVYLGEISTVLAGDPVAVGGQNMYHEAAGAFTGETSAAMLLDSGCQYVILGHSERRHILGETDQDVNRRTHAALSARLICSNGSRCRS